MKQYKNSIEKDSRGWVAFAFNSKAAQVLNARFKKYQEADFEVEGSEGIFRFADEQLPFVRATLLKFGGLE